MKNFDPVTTRERTRDGVDTMRVVSANHRTPLPDDNAANHKQSGNDNQKNLGALFHCMTLNDA